MQDQKRLPLLLAAVAFDLLSCLECVCRYCEVRMACTSWDDRLCSKKPGVARGAPPGQSSWSAARVVLLDTVCCVLCARSGGAGGRRGGERGFALGGGGGSCSPRGPGRLERNAAPPPRVLLQVVPGSLARPEGTRRRSGAAGDVVRRAEVATGITRVVRPSGGGRGLASMQCV